ncbi:MAG: hypothetical protein MJ072_02780, partial [Clostridia bacterium]|nr:hypothetical protein [Clostridia bacterium]
DAFKTGMGEYLDKLTFHDYSETETRTQETASIFRYIVNKYNPRVKLAMGETGCPSSGEGFGALNLGNWTEDKQARLLLKRMVAELRNDVDFISWFTAVDMIEALHGETGKLSTYLDYGYFGVLRAEFDENGISTGDYSKKPSFYVLQNVISLFQHAKQAFVPVLVRSRTFDEKTYGLSCEYEDLDIATFEKPNGGKAFAYWKNVNTLTSTFDGFLSLIVDMPIKSVNLVDPLTGDIMEIPSTCIKYDDGVTEITGLPVKDYPLVLTFDGFIKGE